MIPNANLSRVGYHIGGAMPLRLQFFTIRYVPNILAERSMSIGVVLFDPTGGFSGVRFLKDWKQVLVFDPYADILVLEALARDIERQFRTGKGEEILRIMEDSFSNAVQLSPGEVCSVDDPAMAIEELASRYLG